MRRIPFNMGQPTDLTTGEPPQHKKHQQHGKPVGVAVLMMVVCWLTVWWEPTAAQADPLVAGVHYELITPTIERTSSKPSVAEIFNFKCPHCFSLAPFVAAWVAKNQDRLTYQAVPVYWSKQTDIPLRAFFAAEFLGKGEEMRQAIFKAHFNNSADIDRVEEILFLAEQLGLDTGTFRQHMESFGVSTKVAQAKAFQDSARVASTPTLVINGKYRVVPGRHAKGTNTEVDYDRLFQIVETLTFQ